MTSRNPNITIFSNSNPQIGYVARTNTQGEEFELVNKYIDYLLFKYRNLKQKKVAIFIEPQIDTGYPDVVVVEYYPIKNLEWKKKRENLNTSELKILFYVLTRKHTSVQEINRILGFPESSIEKSLKTLSECGLVRLSKSLKFVSNVKLDSFCKIRKIISIEAKLDKWSDAIRQANNNIWFSTESYILLNKETCKQDIFKNCEKAGLGVILLNGKAKTVLQGQTRSFPVSYASLQFNEWILRNIYMEEF